MSWKRLAGGYFALVSLSAHLLVGTIVLMVLAPKVENSAVLKSIKRTLTGPLDGIEVTPLPSASPGSINSELRNLLRGRWYKIHQQSADDAVVFQRQAHGGSAFDSARGRLMLLGSETHGNNWFNAPFFFDMTALRWSTPYPPDAPSTYGTDSQGNAVAGPEANHPWAMHTFGTVIYHPDWDALVLASQPSHMKPGRFGNALKNVWSKVRRHPNWAYGLATGEWRMLPGEPMHFFPYAVAFDSRRRHLVGVRPDGYWELSGEPPAWRHLAKGTPYNWHTVSKYDPAHDVVVTFGANNKANDVWQYRIGEERGRKMPTPEVRPPGSQAQPFSSATETDGGVDR